MPYNITPQDIYYLNLAIISARSAFKLENIPIGAALVVDNDLLGADENKKNEKESLFEHAELRLISKYAVQVYSAFKAGSEIKLYSTLEPCIQCLGAAVINHINKIVYITKDPNAGACNLEHNNIRYLYTHTWPEIVYAPISQMPLAMMMRYYQNEIKKGDSTFPRKLLRLYQEQKMKPK